MVGYMSKLQKFKRLAFYYFRAYSDSKGINNNAGDNRVIVHVQTPLKFRFYYRLIYILTLAGYKVFIYLPSNKAFYDLAKMDGGLDLLPPMKLITRIPKWFHSAVYCSDQQDQLWNKDWQKKIYIELDLEKPSNNVFNPIFIPFSVHDYIHRCFWKERKELLVNPKNIRMFFSGAYLGYTGMDISSFLGKMERQEIIETYRNHPNTITVTNQNQLDEILSGPPSTKYYWVDSDQFRVPGSQWLKVLSHVEVFLCPPGVVNVMCYNANEAMAMGAIPLINYPEWFHPHLTDRENSFVFSNKEEFVEYLDQISEYSKHDLSSMKKNILNYFDLYQSDDFILRKMKNYENCQAISFIMNVEQEKLKDLSLESIAISPE